MVARKLFFTHLISRVIKNLVFLCIVIIRYEGTVWDDLAHGKGVYEAEQGLVRFDIFGYIVYLYLHTLLMQCMYNLYYRYEGEWLQNNPEGHGVLEVDIPTYEPVPGSEYVYHPNYVLMFD